MVKFGRYWALASLVFVLFATSGAQDQRTVPKPRQDVLKLIGDAGALADKGQTELSLKKATEAVDLAKTNKDEAGEAAARWFLAVQQLEIGKLSEAQSELVLSRKLFAKIADKPSEAFVLRDLGAVCERLGKPDEAARHYTDALGLDQAAKNAEGESLSQLALAKFYLHRDPETAIKHADKCLDLVAKTRDGVTGAECLLVAGRAHSRLANRSEAVKCFAASASLAEDIGLSSVQTAAIGLMGAEYEDAGHYSVALDQYQQALGLAKKTKDRRSEGLQLINLGIVSEKIGQTRVASDYFREAATVFEETGDASLGASAMQNLGATLHKEGKDDQAKDWLNRALEAHKKSGNVIGRAGCLGTLGALARKAGQFDEARQKLDEARALFKETGDQKSEATALDAIGCVLADEGKHEEALVKFDAAITMYDGVGAQPEAATTLGNRASAQVELGRLDAAETSYREAIGRFEAIRTALGALSEAKISYLNERVDVYKEYVKVLALRGKSEVAFDVAQMTKARGLLDLLTLGRVFPNTKMTEDERATEQRLRERADALNARMVKEGVENEVGAKKRYAALAEELKAVEDELNKFMTSLYAKHPELSRARAAETATIGQFQTVMPEDTVVVEFVVCEDDVVALVATKQNGLLTILSRTMAVNRQDLARDSAALRLACSNPKNDYQTLAQDLYRELIQPIEKDFVGKKRLVFCPDACLWDVPFSVLMPDATTFLVDRYEVSYCYSATGVLAALTAGQQIPTAKGGLLICANPDFGSSTRFSDMVNTLGVRPIDQPSRPIDQPSRPIDQPSRPIDQPSRPIDQPSRPIDQPSRAFDQPSRAFDQPSRAIDAVSRGMSAMLSRAGAIVPLPGTQREADAIKALSPDATVLVGKDVQESTFKKVAGSYSVLHLATHGFVNDASPLLSSIVMAQPEKGSSDDGFLTARELFGIDLNAELVVLSACNSARGENRSGEGIMGLTWALFVAGCPSQVVSQWAVDDASTAELMSRFYTHLTGEKQVKSTALHNALQSIKADARYRHPYYWAPFVMVGNWR